MSHSLTLNASKTKLITFSLNITSQPSTPITLQAHSCQLIPPNCSSCPLIRSTDTIKYLGITLDKHLNFKAHTSLLTGRVRKLINFFKTLRHTANAHIRSVYYAMCQSVISYCITSWGGAAKSILKPLEVAQRAVLKVATFRPILYPTFDSLPEMQASYAFFAKCSYSTLFCNSTLTFQLHIGRQYPEEETGYVLYLIHTLLLQKDSFFIKDHLCIID